MTDIKAEKRRQEENLSTGNFLEQWGPYVSERQWGTVREDYSNNSEPWEYFPHDHARSRAYLWGEDGIAGISDFFQNICFAPAFWNGKDDILKERLFGLSNPQGNHGEDVKELYFALDNTPTHYYMKWLYKYPIQKFPYETLIKNNANRNKQEPEYEILDTGIFNTGYFDIQIEYVKKHSRDIFIRIEAINRSAKTAPLFILPTVWFYNRWQSEALKKTPIASLVNAHTVSLQHERMGEYYFYFQNEATTWFTNNETNFEKLFNRPNKCELVKDAFHEALVKGKNKDALEQARAGTKFAPVYSLQLKPGEHKQIVLRISDDFTETPFDMDVAELFSLRKKEADDFYAPLLYSEDPELVNLQRQAFAGLLWNRQYYHYDVEWWLKKTDGITPISDERKEGRNSDWKFLKNQDIITMPDKWEYPWYAAWDSAFHAISMALIDPSFAKHQLLLLMREWFMNPEGQLPAYEWDFGNVNPPVHAFAAFQVYQIEFSISGKKDLNFLKQIFQKLIINFTWWVNRKDANGNSIFEGGFLGMDNIGLFNRNQKLAEGVLLEQTDGTSWMGMYALNMMQIAMEIATHDSSFEDTTTKFYEHYVIIGEALNQLDLWNKEDRFFYDVLSVNQTKKIPLKIRSIVGLVPLFAAAIFENNEIENLPDFNKRMKWFENYRRNNDKYLPNEETNDGKRILLSLVNKEKLVAILERIFDEEEFLSTYGIRSLSKVYKDNPYTVKLDGDTYTIEYDPANSTSGMFGGNSNWRGPIWFPINYLFIKSLHTYYDFYGDDLKIEFPKGSGVYQNLQEAACAITHRLLGLFLKNEKGQRPVFGPYADFYKNENDNLFLFHEYFDGDTGMGLGASHQTGWTALILNLLQDMKEREVCPIYHDSDSLPSAPVDL